MAGAASKQCRKCGLTKDRTEFYSHPKYRTRDKLSVDCKACIREYVRQCWKQHPDRMRAIARASYHKRRVSRPVACITSRMCLLCGVSFTPSKCYPGQKYCCHAHRSRAYNVTADGRRAHNERGRKARRLARERRAPSVCALCGCEFMAKRSDARFCTLKCYWKYKNRARPRGYYRDAQRRWRAKHPDRYKEQDRKRRRSQLYVTAKRAYLRDYYHSHKADYSRRRSAWLQTPSGAQKRRAKYARDTVRRLSRLPEPYAEIRLAMLQFKRWCRANGYTGTKQLFAEEGMR